MNQDFKGSRKIIRRKYKTAKSQNSHIMQSKSQPILQKSLDIVNQSPAQYESPVLDLNQIVLNQQGEKYDQENNSQIQSKINKDQTQTSINKIQNGHQDQSNTNLLYVPYQFLQNKEISFFHVLFPHFKLKSVMFIITLIMISLFILLLIKVTKQQQGQLTWSCTLFHLQNKFFARLRYNYEIWRILVSMFFHSNISHFVLNIIGIQMYGYIMQWYYGKLKYCITLLLSMIISHLLSCLTNVMSVSTTSSSVLYSFLGLQLLFFIKYWNYKPIESFKFALIGLYILILGINILILFVGSNVDYGSYIGGFITGLLCGITFYKFQIQTKLTKCIKIVSMMTLLSIMFGLIIYCFTINEQLFLQLNEGINKLC